ncbi:MAG: 5-oxoprolinase subunit PxpB [Parvularculaceae bacterium]
MSGSRLSDVAEDALELAVNDAAEAQRIAAWLRDDGSFEEVVAGLASIVVRYDPTRCSRDVVAARLETGRAAAPIPEAAEAGPIDVPVRYGGGDGPDLDGLAGALGLSADEIVRRHASPLYTVDMIGFMPGFAYLSGLDPVLEAPRLAAPRQRVPAGSVGVSGLYAGIYALGAPGGWPLIGRTPATLFNAEAANPFVLRPGARVRFAPL